MRLRALLARPSLDARPLPHDGVLGSDALGGGRVVIDFQAGEFSISGVR